MQHLDDQAERTLKYLDAHFDDLIDKGYDGISKFAIGQLSDAICLKDGPTVIGGQNVIRAPGQLTEEGKAVQDAERFYQWYTKLDSSDGPWRGRFEWMGRSNADGITRKDIAAGLAQLGKVHGQIDDIKKQLTDWKY
jgi:hypothetical protein